LLVCGQEGGNLSLINVQTLKVVGSLVLSNPKSHVNVIARTPDPWLFLVGTNKGMFKVKISEKNFTMMSAAYLFEKEERNWINIIACIDEKQALLAF
jgi:hypothetical protein